MSTMKNSSFFDQLALIKIFYYLLMIGIPVTIVLLNEEGSLADRVAASITNIKVILFVFAFVIMAFAGSLLIKKGFLDDFDRYDKIVEVEFKKDKVKILMTDGKEYDIPLMEILNVEYTASYEIKELEYSRNNLLIQWEEELMVFPFTSKEIYYKFLDVLDNETLGNRDNEE